MLSDFALCNVSIAPIRSEPAHKAEQTNQLLFGEKVEIVEYNNKEWAKVNCKWEGYSGWCKKSQLFLITKKEFAKPTKHIAASNGCKIIMKSGEMWLPIGAELAGLKKGFIFDGFETGKFFGKKLKLPEVCASDENITNSSYIFLHAPYEWGGRSISGIDCSGLTQIIFKLNNITIPRDASQQAQIGSTIDFLQDALLGDLAFFDDKDGKINHTGLLLNNQTIIHASESTGRVTIDKIDPKGIVSVSLKKRTHNLRFVKRILIR